MRCSSPIHCAGPLMAAALPRLFLARGELHGERILTEAQIERMERPATTLAARAGVEYGYGLGLYAWIHAGFVFRGHGGDGDGYLSRFGYSRDTGKGYFLTINAFNGKALDAMRDRVEDSLVAGHEPPEPPPRAGTPSEELAALTGTYRSVTRRFPWQEPPEEAGEELRVVLEEGRLYRKEPEGARKELIPVGGRRFRHRGEPVATAAFAEEAGELFLQGAFGNYRRMGP